MDDKVNAKSTYVVRIKRQNHHSQSHPFRSSLRMRNLQQDWKNVSARHDKRPLSLSLPAPIFTLSDYGEKGKSQTA